MRADKNGLYQAALDVHRALPSGKVVVKSAKSVMNKQDLSLLYSPGVAAPCLAIAEDPRQANVYTSKSNTVAVISDGSAVLGLGNLGPLASKPVMEGKVALFSSLAYLNGVDLEIKASSPGQLVRCIQQISGSFGAINLEDIKAPECFEIERKLRKSLNIPVLHDDQHGTAVAVLAALMNAVRLQGKVARECRVVINGAGAAALATAHLLCQWEIRKKNILFCDSRGVINRRRTDINKYKKVFAVDTEKATLAEAIQHADVFIGLSVGKVLTEDMVRRMAAKPIIFALANPVPEIMPELAMQVCPDAIVAVGRSDYRHQINNVLCFPYIFRGALDAEASEINPAMLIAAAHEIAKIAEEIASEERTGQPLIVPDVFEPQLLSRVPYAVIKAAMETGVAGKSISKADYDKKITQLKTFYG